MSAKDKKAELNLGGRPSKYEDVVEKLERAFEDGASISEACIVAEIDRKTYYNWIESIDGFSTKMESAQNWTTEIARANISKKIVKRGDTELSKWWLERKGKDFGAKHDVRVTEMQIDYVKDTSNPA